MINAIISFFLVSFCSSVFVGIMSSSLSWSLSYVNNFVVSVVDVLWFTAVDFVIVVDVAVVEAVVVVDGVVVVVASSIITSSITNVFLKSDNNSLYPHLMYARMIYMDITQHKNTTTDNTHKKALG